MVFNLSAQENNNTKSIQDFESYRKKMLAKKLKQPFPLTENLTDIFGKEVDLTEMNKPTFVRLGYIGCHPCSFEMPAFVRLAKEYPNVNFIYITYNSKDELQEHYDYIDFELENLNFVQMTDKKMRDNKLANGYPTNWLIKKGNIVQHYSGGGRTSELELSYKKFKNWVEEISELQVE